MNNKHNVWRSGFYNNDRLELFTSEQLKNNLLTTHHHGHRLDKSFKSEIRSCLNIFNQCIVPYINSDTNVLEIGPGRGAWTLKMTELNPKSITCLDIFSAEYNNFDVLLLKEKNNITYFQIENNKCEELKDNSIDFLFSYDVFCHIPYNKCEEYLQHL